ncbi:early nodulin-like protein 17, partial [Prunus dulcis]
STGSENFGTEGRTVNLRFGSGPQLTFRFSQKTPFFGLVWFGSVGLIDLSFCEINQNNGRKKNCLFVEPTQTQNSTRLESFLNCLQRIISVNQETEKAEKEETNQRRNMWKSCNTTHLILFLLFISGLAVLTPILATDHIVGANRGWNPGINYTLWANNQTFYVGDLISFRYPKNQYNVFECCRELEQWQRLHTLNHAKRYYFICGNGQCYNGMKVSVVVHPLPSPPKAAPGAHNSSSESAVLVVPRQGFRALANFTHYNPKIVDITFPVITPPKFLVVEQSGVEPRTLWHQHEFHHRELQLTAPIDVMGENSLCWEFINKSRQLSLKAAAQELQNILLLAHLEVPILMCHSIPVVVVCCLLELFSKVHPNRITIPIKRMDELFQHHSSILQEIAPFSLVFVVSEA